MIVQAKQFKFVDNTSMTVDSYKKSTKSLGLESTERSRPSFYACLVESGKHKLKNGKKYYKSTTIYYRILAYEWRPKYFMQLLLK